LAAAETSVLQSQPQKLQPPPARPVELRAVLKDAVVALSLTAFLLAGKWILEQTRSFQFVEESFYELLQFHLSSSFDPKSLDVVVVDVSNLPMTRSRGDRKRDYTNRDELLRVVREIARQEPRGIAIDVDFTP
jgi:hypothetical protein